MGTSARIWVIDHEQDERESVTALLCTAEYDARGFATSRDALQALDEEVPELILLELKMPQMTGGEWLRMLRGRPDGQLVPVLAMTSMASESSVLNALEAGADDVLRKPVSVSELLARISNQLNRSARLGGLLQENADLVALTELAQALGSETALPDILRRLVDGLRRALNVETAAFYLTSEDGDLHRALPADPTRAEGSPNHTLDLRDLVGVADKLAQREPALLDDDGAARLHDAMGGQLPQAQSGAVFPMVRANKLTGVVVLTGARRGVGTAQRDRVFASIATAYAAVAVERAELFQSVRREHTAAEAVNQELRKTRDFLENVILSSPDAIVASNGDGKIVLYNAAAERILGWSREEAIGSNVRILYPPGGAERIMKMLRSSDQGGRGRLEVQREVVVDNEGREIPVEISAALVEAEGAWATVGIFTDLRSRIRMENKLQEATENLERTRRQAVIAELAGATAHELNQPLTSLLGYAEFLQRRLEDADDAAKRAISTIERDATRIADIVAKIGKITEYRTKEYVGGARIVDLDGASESSYTKRSVEPDADDSR